MTQTRAPVRAYRAFWHLHAIGVLSVDPKNPSGNYTSAIWEQLEGSPAAKVALIDTGVDTAHVYLKDRIVIDEVLDLTGMPIKVVEKKAARLASGPFSEFPTKLDELGVSLDDADMAQLKSFLDDNKDCAPFDSGAPKTANLNFSSHGTSCAGLVVGRTPVPEKSGQPAPAPTAYFGVDPFSKLISVTTSFAPRPEPLILAFLFAWVKGADAILFPRGLPDDLLDKSANCAPGWRILREVILAVSRKIPIICAAGNDAESRLIAPAALAGAAWSPNGVIAVGAMNFRGIRSSYSSYDEDLTVCAPSDDGEIFDVDQYRLDQTDRTYPDYPYVATLKQNGFHEQPETVSGDEVSHNDPEFDLKSNLFAEQTIMAIDIPGPFGFEGSGSNLGYKDLSNTQFSGDFTEFGGTSAASAIVAGAAALIQRKMKKMHPKDQNARLNGLEVKALLKSTARTMKLPHLDLEHLPSPATGNLIADHINGRSLTRQQAFGAGLVDVDAAVKAVK